MLFNIRGKWMIGCSSCSTLRSMMPRYRLEWTAHGDQPLAAPSRGRCGRRSTGGPVGQCCCRSGMAKCTYGTGFFADAYRQQADAIKNRLLTTVAWQIGGNNGIRPREACSRRSSGTVAVILGLINRLRDRALGQARARQRRSVLCAGVHRPGRTTLEPQRRAPSADSAVAPATLTSPGRLWRASRFR